MCPELWQEAGDVRRTIAGRAGAGGLLPDPERVGRAEPLRSGWAWAEAIDPRDIDAYLPLVQRVVRKVARRLPANVERDDLLAAGVFGLVDSLRRNGGDGGAAFAWYARVRIRGAVFDELRAQDWLSRRARDGMAEDAAASFVSFDDVDHEERELAGGDDPAALVEASSERRALAAALDRLSERERLVVARYYFDGARMKDIGAELGLSEPRISQILARALGRLREILAGEAA